jgi:hypothetical protein
MVFDHGKYYEISDWWWATTFAWLPAKMDNGNFVWWKDWLKLKWVRA